MLTGETVKLSPAGAVAGMCTLCAVAVAGLYFVAIVARAVASAAPLDPGQTFPLIAFTAFGILGALLGGGAVTWTELSGENHRWTLRIGLALFLATTVSVTLSGLSFMVLMPPVYILAAIALTIIVARRRFGRPVHAEIRVTTGEEQER